MSVTQTRKFRDIQKSVLFFPVFSSSSFLLAVLSFSTVPDHAHFLCRDFDSAIRLAAEPPLADLIETIWIVGGVQVYKVNQYSSIHLDYSVFKVEDLLLTCSRVIEVKPYTINHRQELIYSSIFLFLDSAIIDLHDLESKRIFTLV